jgi:hypothetical protein
MKKKEKEKKKRRKKKLRREDRKKEKRYTKESTVSSSFFSLSLSLSDLCTVLSTVTLNSRGVTLMDAGKYQEAVDDFSKVEGSKI